MSSSSRAPMLLLFLTAVVTIVGNPVTTEIQTFEMESGDQVPHLYFFQLEILENEDNLEEIQALENGNDENYGEIQALDNVDEASKPTMEKHFLKSIITDTLALFLVFAVPCLGLILFLIVMSKERKSRLRRRAALKSAEKYEIF